MGNLPDNRAQISDQPSSRQEMMEGIDLLTLGKSRELLENTREGNQTSARQRKEAQEESDGNSAERGREAEGRKRS